MFAVFCSVNSRDRESLLRNLYLLLEIWKMSIIVLGTKLCFTLYIKIKMSCSLRFSKLGSFVQSRSCSYVAVLLLNIAHNALSCTLSSFVVSDALQICQTVWP